MKIPFLALLVFTTAAGLSPALADAPSCADAARAVLSQAYPTAVPSADGQQLLLAGRFAIELPSEGIGSPHETVCKIWPARPDLLLMAVPLIDTKQSTEDENFGDLDLLVVDAKTREIRQRLRQPGLMEDDAVAIKGIEFDTAAYRLKPDLLAFGLRIKAGNYSAAAPLSETSLLLYVVENGRLRGILDRFYVTSSTSERGGDCVGQSENEALTLTMGGAGRDGYRDIVMTEMGTAEADHLGKDGACLTRVTHRSKKTYSLGYDGTRYVLPKGLK